MAYLHCHNCHWSQDDFWDKDYNPFTWTGKNMLDDLLNIHKEDADHNPINLKRLLIQCTDIIDTLYSMKYPTYESYCKENPQGICPQCGKQTLDVD